MDRGAILEYLGPTWARTQDLIRSALDSDVSSLSGVNGSILNNSGKQLRPIVSLLMAKACGEPNGDSEIIAASAEILHNATLIHDDVADESSRRRGKPTLFSLLGAGTAVLVGDFWLARAMEVMMKASCSSKVSGLFSKTLTDLAEGEMLQLEKSVSADTTEEDYYRIIYCKTASLFEASVVSGALSVGACPEYVEAARNYACAVGMAFQIKDDILDYAGDAQLGKPLGIDLLEKKITLPLLGALKDSREEDRMRKLVCTLDTDSENREIVRKFVSERGGIAYASARLDEYIRKAEKALEVLPDTEAVHYLVGIARYNAFRTI